MSQTTITIVNPFSGAIVERDAAEYDQDSCDLFASRMDDEEMYLCEGGDSSAEWIVGMVERLGAKRAGQIILS